VSRSVGALLVLWSAAAGAQESVVRTRHNLSVTGPGPVRAAQETKVCIFCHVPHGGLELGINRPLSRAKYQPYESTTLEARPGVPDGATRICLSCHDGTIALGQTAASGHIAVERAGVGGTMPTGPGLIGTDLRASHPVSFAPTATAEVHAPAEGDAVRLDRRRRLQCTSCHDPHTDKLDPIEGNFLVKPNRESAICLSCHAPRGWETNPSAHSRSTATFTRAQGSTKPYATVAETGCESCHRPHAAGTPARLLAEPEPDLCLRCHAGQVARADIRADLQKPYAHPMLDAGPSSHDAAEGPESDTHPLPERRTSQPRHVVCSDCHDAHEAYALPAVAPRAGGSLAGVWGIDRNGHRVGPVAHEYEVCFKCHGDSVNQPQLRGGGAQIPSSLPARAVRDVNLRRVFDPSGPSAHPVIAPARGRDVPSLIPPLTPGSLVYCTDCHGSGAADPSAARGAEARGPHGSIFPHILERQYLTADRTAESPLAYALCYKCHDREVLLDPARTAFPTHRLHVVDGSSPCSACHDPHGVSPVQGTAVENAHLINFDVSIVRPNRRGLRRYVSMGPRNGRCSLSCHGYEHDETPVVPAFLRDAPGRPPVLPGLGR